MFIKLVNQNSFFKSNHDLQYASNFMKVNGDSFKGIHIYIEHTVHHGVYFAPRR